MGKFTEWFGKKLIAGRYPTPGEIIKSNFDTIINVSDEYIIANHRTCDNHVRKYFWFPMNENGGNIGLNSIFATLQILWLAEVNDERVLVHCHAGSNRSVTIVQLYYYMRTKKHFVEEITKHSMSEEDGFRMFNITDDESKETYRRMSKQNRVQNNIEAGCLPARLLLEDFLKECEQAFINYEIGNISLDAIKYKTKITSY